MVRRVRLGRRHDPGRPLRWNGPPPVLLVATVAAFAVLPFVHHGAAPRGAVAPASAPVAPSGASRGQDAVQHLEVSRGGVASAGLAPLRLKPAHVGVASFNMFYKLSADQARQDAQRLTREADVDVIGWQEAQNFSGVLHALPGWQTYTSPGSELAVSWRSSQFDLVTAHLREVARGVTVTEGRYPFARRLVLTVTLRHLETGRTLTVVDAHLPHMIEDLARPGHWTPTLNAGRARAQLRSIASTWRGLGDHEAIGTGDFNFDARADAAEDPAGGPRAVLGPVAISSYMALGTDVGATYPENDRRIDYVWADREAYEAGRIRFTAQRVVGGMNSDHNALVAHLLLS
ncbi:endonuclease/exonuclease/phosphatase family protein [Nocardioides sp.]|uniref:endonuclease/exonuclease/phosphatase family protein n=1 Tax=Nocardioides sp. TaxID=35761 RepID=UPI0037849068